MKPVAEIAEILRGTPGATVIDCGHDGVGSGIIFTLGRLRCIAASGMDWDHVSVSLSARCPRWDEMERVRKLVTCPGEIWVQYGLPPALHINVHSNVLHWWRPHGAELPLPPREMV